MDRMVSEYEAAVAGYRGRSPLPISAIAAARAYLSLAETAIERRAFDRAHRLAQACLALEGLREEDLADRRQMLQYIEERHDLFEEAGAVLSPSSRRRPAGETSRPGPSCIMEALSARHVSLARWRPAPCSCRSSMYWSIRRRAYSCAALEGGAQARCADQARAARLVRQAEQAPVARSGRTAVALVGWKACSSRRSRGDHCRR